jgi:hypothetical protein
LSLLGFECWIIQPTALVTINTTLFQLKIASIYKLLLQHIHIFVLKYGPLTGTIVHPSWSICDVIKTEIIHIVYSSMQARI